MGKLQHGGIDSARFDFSQDTTDSIVKFLPSFRGLFIKQNYNKIGSYGEFLLGCRFNNDTSVIARIETSIDEGGFLENPALRIMEALKDCARADFWYAFEKDYK